MRTKLILTGLGIVSLLIACSDRNEEDVAIIKPRAERLGKYNSRIESKTKGDTLKTQMYNESNNKESELETIDPTKPDKPW